MQKRRATTVWRLRSAVRSAARKSAGSGWRQNLAMVLERSIDVVLQHGDDQFVLVVEVRIEAPRVSPAASAIASMLAAPMPCSWNTCAAPRKVLPGLGAGRAGADS